MRDKFLKSIHPVHAFPSGVVAANEDIFNGDPASDVIRVSNAEACIFVVTMNANGSSGTATLTVESCDDVTPTTTTAIAFNYRLVTAPNTLGAVTAATASGFTTSGTANTQYWIEVDPSDMVDGDAFIRLQCTEVTNQPVDGAMIAMLVGQKQITAGGLASQVV